MYKKDYEKYRKNEKNELDAAREEKNQKLDEEKQLETIKEEIKVKKEQLKKTFFLNVNRKNELKAEIDSKENKINELESLVEKMKEKHLMDCEKKMKLIRDSYSEKNAPENIKKYIEAENKYKKINKELHPIL